MARSSVADAELVLGELLTNAILHGAPDAAGMVEVSWLLDRGRLLVSVHDDGHVDDLRAGPLTEDGVSGRGLAVVDGLCSHWHVEHDGGTRVVAQLALATA